MKYLFYTAILLVLPAMTYCQQTIVFASDQNLHYKESQDRYMKVADSLTTFHSTTLQQTYKAYDWREAKHARKQQNREWRHQEILNRPYTNYYYWSDYNPYNYWSDYSPYNYYVNPWRSQYYLFGW